MRWCLALLVGALWAAPAGAQAPSTFIRVPGVCFSQEFLVRVPAQPLGIELVGETFNQVPPPPDSVWRGNVNVWEVWRYGVTSGRTCLGHVFPATERSRNGRPRWAAYKNDGTGVLVRLRSPYSDGNWYTLYTAAAALWQAP